MRGTFAGDAGQRGIEIIHRLQQMPGQREAEPPGRRLHRVALDGEARVQGVGDRRHVRAPLHGRLQQLEPLARQFGR